MAAERLKCPACGSEMVARIVYGEAPQDEESRRDLASGRVILCAGPPTEQDPRFQCLECSIGWKAYPRGRSK